MTRNALISTGLKNFEKLCLVLSIFTMFSEPIKTLVGIMLLEFGMEIDANGDFTKINLDFVDRDGIIRPSPRGGVAYDSPLGYERDKWEFEYGVRVVPGKTLLETPEDFLYWRAKNRNHVFCMEPSRFPWRIFPATFLKNRIPVRYITDDKTAGEIITFQVAEQ
ncbi:MAG: hypothetical protein OXU23_01345 [Candidatus Poribacteria bacterium]|nr:hypothetical protein [Candidatus Poribacteria bacterium]